MKTACIRIGVAAVLAGSLLACQRVDMDEMSMNPNLDITYPAGYVVNAEGNSLSVIELASQQVRETISFGTASAPGGHSSGGMNMGSGIAWPHHLSLSPDGKRIAIGVPGEDLSAGHVGGSVGMTGRVVVLDARTGELLTNLKTPAMNHNAIFSPDGSEIWTSQMTEAGRVLVYNAATMVEKASIPVGKEPAEVTFSTDGQYAFVANGGAGTVSVIRVSDKAVVKYLAVGEDPVGAWPGSDGRMYVDNEMGQSISVIDVATLSVVETLPLGFTPGYAAFHAGRNEIWISQAQTGTKVVVYERRNNAWVKGTEIATGRDAHAIAFSADGQTAFITNQGAGTVSVVNVATRTKVRDIPVGKKPNGIVLKF